MKPRAPFLSSGWLAVGIAAVLLWTGCAVPEAPAVSVAKNLAIVTDAQDPVVNAAPVQRALDQFRRAVMARGFSVLMCSQLSEAGSGDLCILVASAGSPLVGELGAVVPGAPLARTIQPGRLSGREVLLTAGRDAPSLALALDETREAVARADNPAAVLRAAPVRDETGKIVPPPPVLPPAKPGQKP